jgi:disulfide bond formation protein DsbB
MSARRSAALIALIGAAALGAALWFEHALGYVPCALCLWQRWAYYIGIPLALLLASGVLPRGMVAAGFIILALVFAANGTLGVWHAGIEWKLWAGPSACSAGAAGPSSGSLIEDLKATRIVPCDAAAWRFLGLSFAGWNAVVSAAIAVLAAKAARR